MKALSEGELLPKIIEAYSRPTRIVRGKDTGDDLEVPHYSTDYAFACGKPYSLSSEPPPPPLII